jgi:thiamine-monophosphate kinase
LSDGLADAVSQLASASGVGIEIDAERLPIEPEARTWFKQHDLDPIDSGLAAGEDYELLFTVSPTARRRLTAVQRLLKNLPLTRIGRVTEHKEIVVQRNGKHAPLPAGYEHFQK